jgi:hypothetical protein
LDQNEEEDEQLRAFKICLISWNVWLVKYTRYCGKMLIEGDFGSIKVEESETCYDELVWWIPSKKEFGDYIR